MALVPFPYDFVYGWIEKHGLDVPKEAVDELIAMFLNV